MGDYHAPPPQPRRDAVAEWVKNFYSQQDLAERQEALRVAHKEANATGSDLVAYLLEHGPGDSGLQNGLEGIEIEMKLAYIPDSADSDAKVLQQFQLPESGRFLHNSVSNESSAEHHYFGTDAEERFCLINNKHGWSLKLKGQAQPYTLGIAGEQFVLRRTETIRDTLERGDMVSFAKNIVTSCEPTPTTYRGIFEKTKATQFAIERNTGRVYSIVFGSCNTTDRDLDRDTLMQLEVEYVGYIPGFPDQNNLESERRIVTDILEMAKYWQDTGRLTPTIVTKYDWLVGKQVEEPEAQLPETPAPKPNKVLTGEQTFFDDEI